MGTSALTTSLVACKRSTQGINEIQQFSLWAEVWHWPRVREYLNPSRLRHQMPSSVMFLAMHSYLIFKWPSWSATRNAAAYV